MKARTRITRIIPALLLICGIFLSLLLSACGESKKDAVVPPIRMSEHPSDASYSFIPQSISEAVEKSDVVAVVRVGDWLGDTGDDFSTLFKAEAIQTVKGEIPAKFTLMQDGTSEFTFSGNPLFTAGNELLLFLDKTSDDGIKRYNLPEDTYNIICGHYTTLDIVTVDGEKYAFPRSPAMFDSLPSTVKNLAEDEAFLEKAVGEFKRADSVWEKVSTVHSRIYKLDELISMIKAG